MTIHLVMYVNGMFPVRPYHNNRSPLNSIHNRKTHQ